MLRAVLMTWLLVFAAPAWAAEGSPSGLLSASEGSPSGLLSASEGSPPGLRSAAEGDAIDVNVTVVHARPAEGGVAPELDKIGRYLLKAFPKHKSFVRLSAEERHLALGAEGRLTLPNRSELVIKHTGWKDGFAAVHIEVGGLTSTVNVKDGGTFFQAGRGYEGGMIVLAIEVRASR